MISTNSAYAISRRGSITARVIVKSFSLRICSVSGIFKQVHLELLLTISNFYAGNSLDSEN